MKRSRNLLRRCLLTASLVFALASFTYADGKAKPAEFLVWSDAPDFSPPKIVIQFDPKGVTGVDWKLAKGRPWYDGSDAAKLGNAVEFLLEGIEKTCGQRLDVVNSNDLSKGIVLTTLAGATDDIRRDADVQAALKSDGSDDYNHREAFFIRSEPERLLIVANTVSGLVVAVPELLESIGYEVLAMGPNWIHVPDGLKQRLTFRLQRAGRPTYYIRGLVATSGQSYGVGTIRDAKLLGDPRDETVSASFRRWQIGRRLKTQSMPSFPGHAMQGHHRALIAHIRQTENVEGFLGTVKLGDEAERPAASDENRGWLWITPKSTAKTARARYDGVFRSDGKQWLPANMEEVGLNLDLSVPVVRSIVLERFKQRSESFFEKSPDDVFVFGTDPEDGGGYARLAELLRYPNWLSQLPGDDRRRIRPALRARRIQRFEATA